MKRQARTDERKWLDMVARVPCVLCEVLHMGPTPAQVHHVRAGQGMAQRAGHFCTVALCPEHHQGRGGVHGDRSSLAQAKVDELDLLDMTVQRVFSLLRNNVR